MVSNPDESGRSLPVLILVATLSKVVLNTTRRLIYPFAPEFARGLGVSLPAVTSIIAVNQTTSVLGPVTASFGDRYGYKPLMLTALGMASVGLFAAGFLPVYSVVLICFFLAGLAKSIFDPVLQAYIGKHVPFEKRGKFIGLTELSWAASTLLGIPLAGVIIDRYSWHTPFIILGVLCLFLFFILLWIMPNGSMHSEQDTLPPNLIAGWKKIIRSRQVIGVLSFSFFMALANDNLFVIYGAWLEDAFQMSLAAIGFGTVIIGASEVAGEGLTAFLADRIGLKRSIVIGVTGCALSYACLPLLAGSFALVLTGLFMVFLTFEFTVVTAMSLSTELVPEFRAATMSAFYAIGGIGRVAGAFLGGIIWSFDGITAIALFSGGCTVIALVSILMGFSKS
ncbi:MAG: MFS transporter [Desulfobacteraceae bacterium]|nr:MAG: MFS transporter [Desulfobacteraceae bacterium]